VFFRLFFIIDSFDIYILAASQRMWALQKLRKLMVSRFGKLLNIPALLKMEQGLNTDSALPTLLKGLPQALLRQYEYEDPAVRSGKHLMHSSFFKVCTCRWDSQEIKQQHLLQDRSWICSAFRIGMFQQMAAFPNLTVTVPKMGLTVHFSQSVINPDSPFHSLSYGVLYNLW
jgi:hypothetical protein